MNNEDLQVLAMVASVLRTSADQLERIAADELADVASTLRQLARQLDDRAGGISWKSA